MQEKKAEIFMGVRNGICDISYSVEPTNWADLSFILEEHSYEKIMKNVASIVAQQMKSRELSDYTLENGIKLSSTHDERVMCEDVPGEYVSLFEETLDTKLDK